MTDESSGADTAVPTVRYADRRPSFPEGGPGPVVEPRRTVADFVDTSTSQLSESPGSSPKTVAIDCGTVVFRESEAGAALKTFDSNDLGIGFTRSATYGKGHISGISKGRRIDLILKVLSDVWVY